MDESIGWIPFAWLDLHNAHVTRELPNARAITQMNECKN